MSFLGWQNQPPFEFLLLLHQNFNNSTWMLFRDCGSKVLSLKALLFFSIGKKKWTGLSKLNAFQRYFHRSFHLLLSLYLIFPKITAETQEQSFWSFQCLWWYSFVNSKASCLKKPSSTRSSRGNWVEQVAISFPHVSHLSQILVQQETTALTNCYL